MRTLTRARASAAASAMLIAGLLGGCSATAPEAPTTPTPASLDGVLPLGDGFLGSNPSPSPEATVAPERGSWDGVVPPAGYRVILITAGDDAPATTVASAVEQWAASRSVDLEVMGAAHDDEVEDHLNAAVEQQPDLIIGAGNAVVDVFSLLTPQHLAQRFLVVGSELPEPTGNTTSVIWPGASFRGSGLGTSGYDDPATFTADRAGEAVEAGVASMLSGLSGIVVSLPQ